VFCKGKESCSRCGSDHRSDSCNAIDYCCVNCKRPHHFDASVPIFHKYKSINTVMAFCNINQYKTKRLIKARNIDSVEQVELTFKATAYYAWNAQDLAPGTNLLKRSSTLSLHKSSQLDLRKLRRRRRSNSGNLNFLGNEGNLHKVISNEDQTLIPQLEAEDILSEQPPLSRAPSRTREVEGSISSIASDNRVEIVFPVPGFILNEIFQLYKNKSNVNEKNSAVIDYIRLIFQKLK